MTVKKDSTNTDDSTNTPVTPPQSDKPEGEGVNESGAGEGEGDKAKKNAKPEGITPEIQAYIDSQSAKARKAAEAKAKADAEAATALAAQQAREKAQRESGDLQGLLDTKTNELNETSSTLKSTQSELRKIKAAIKAGLPDPLTNYKRLIDTDDDDELAEDAKTLKKSFGTAGHRDETKPPATPDGKGGKHTDDKTKNEKEDLDSKDVASALNTGLYSGLSF